MKSELHKRVLIVVFHIQIHIYTHTIDTHTHIQTHKNKAREGIAHCQSHIPVKVRETQRPAQMAFVLHQQCFQSVVKHSHVELIHTLTHLCFAFKHHVWPVS